MFMKPRAPSRKAGLVDRILDFVEELKELHRLRAVMDDLPALRPHVPPSELSVAVDMFVATAQGVCGQEIDARARRAAVRFALEGMAPIRMARGSVVGPAAGPCRLPTP